MADAITFNCISTILRVLYQKKNSVGYRVLVQNVAQRGFSFTQIEEGITCLFQKGWLIRQEKRAGISRWEIFKLEIIPFKWPEVESTLGIRRFDRTDILTQLSLVTMENEQAPMAERLRRILSNQYEQLLSKEEGVLSVEGRTLASSRYPEKYLTIMNTLLEIYGLVKTHERISFRNLALRITGESKGLSPYKKDIEQLLGADLRGFYIYDHSDLCYVSGPFTYRIRGLKGSGKGGYPYIILTEETVAEIEIMEMPKTQILVIENLTVFEEILRRGYYERNDVIILFSQGYISQVQISFILKLLTHAQISEIFMWADPDPFGIDIFRNFSRHLEKLGVEVKPVLMDKHSCKRLRIMKPLGNADQELLISSQQEGLPEGLQQLWKYFVDSGMKGEQESFLEVLTDKELLELIPVL
ncbi:Wadjet anti-phage system protein JetD domain-containing protein [Desulfitobacterium chlororespirans]|nr:Wadjet anti-phage system protein JetD domain-containing protein [Desulfitobacterium chlororespirans]